LRKRDAGQAYAGFDNVVNATRLVVADVHDGILERLRSTDRRRHQAAALAAHVGREIWVS
jgi:hypothetical protein